MPTSIDAEPRVDATPRARKLIGQLVRAHGPLIFHQSGGCCDGSAPMCYPRGEFLLGARDALCRSAWLKARCPNPAPLADPQRFR